jgi:hypothetical protein
MKNFLFPKIWFEPMFFSGFFCGFERCGSPVPSAFGGAAPLTISSFSLAAKHSGKKNSRM